MSAILAGVCLACLVVIAVLVSLVKKMQKGMNGFYEENRRLRDLVGQEKK